MLCIGKGMTERDEAFTSAFVCMDPLYLNHLMGLLKMLILRHLIKPAEGEGTQEPF